MRHSAIVLFISTRRWRIIDLKFTSYRSNHSRLRWLNLAIILAMLFSLFPLDIPLPGPLPDLGAEEASASISAPAFVETQRTAGASPAITYGSSDDDFTGDSLEAGISPSAPEVNANALRLIQANNYPGT